MRICRGETNLSAFSGTAIRFVGLLFLLTSGLELFLAHLNRHGDYAVGQDVHAVIRAASKRRPDVTTVVLGDSVAHQLFRLEAEPSREVLYLSSNQAISMAGQYALLQRAMRNCPHLHRVYLFYTPYSWANNLDQIFTHDYFCGYFHNPSLIWEIWRLKHDTNLLGAHVARMLLPNIMAFNSYINRGQSYFGVPTTVVSAGPQEPMSEVSVYYLRKIRRLCRDQGISLAILPAPCFGTEAQFATVASAYDTRIHLYDPQLFVADHIHLKKAAIDPVRRQVVEEFHLRELR